MNTLAQFGNVSYSQSNLIHRLVIVFKGLEDKRNHNQQSFSLQNILMTAFGVFHSNHPSLAEAIRDIKETKENCRKIYSIDNIPTDDTVRNVLDDIPPDDIFSPAYKAVWSIFQRSGKLQSYQYFNGKYLAAFDGTQYFVSNKIKCDRCNTKKTKNGTSYSHQALQVAVMSLDQKEPLPLYAEEIAGEGNNSKQDCEINAAKRCIAKIKQDHPKLGLVLVGDALFSNTPMIQEILSCGWDYIINTKCKSQKTLNINVADEECESGYYINRKGLEVKCYWKNNVALNKSESTLVNFCKVVEYQKSGEAKYVGQWITNIEITAENAGDIAAGGRARWMIENECFNTLKQHQFHMGHNYGHGKKNLSFNFYGMLLLAFLCQQIGLNADKLVKSARMKSVTQSNFWQNVRSLLQFVIIDSGEYLMGVVSGLVALKAEPYSGP